MPARNNIRMSTANISTINQHCPQRRRLEYDIFVAVISYNISKHFNQIFGYDNEITLDNVLC